MHESGCNERKGNQPLATFLKGRPDARSRPRDIAGRFAIPPAIARIQPLGRGLINATFQVTTGDGAMHVLQRLNPAVIADPAPVMANLRQLARLARQSPEDTPRIPEPIPTRDGADWLRAADGGVWRMLEFIPHAVHPDGPVTPGRARAAGAALGAFHRLLARVPPARFAVTVPGFHETPVYLARCDAALAVAGDASELSAIRDFIAARRELAGILAAARDAGEIPIRVIHGDPKLDNLLFDQSGERVLALIDLDTVQPGLLLHDIADCLRSCCRRIRPDMAGISVGDGGLDPARMTEVRFDPDPCRAILGGHASTAGALLYSRERDLLTTAMRLLPFELGLRFLTDHLEGDRYFRVAARGENLRKALVQFALVTDIERQEPALRQIVHDCFAGAGS